VYFSARQEDKNACELKPLAEQVIVNNLNKHMPRVVDWFDGNFVPRQSEKAEPLGRDAAGALHEAGEDGRTRGDSERFVRHSAYTAAVQHPLVTAAVIAAIGLGAIGLVSRSGDKNGKIS